ncbi:wiskott-Aldrich syndrome protein homolog [Alosa sapidissima]|uniref:wiskott-Aldrich syndrome protein homolog n=1 Tax=Alosa sapidissima TaxID=34773 RepID=UPI001C093223|nr:wiskott-Aldrich syndrome protein homolog [Alosa sapidissima]
MVSFPCWCGGGGGGASSSDLGVSSASLPVRSGVVAAREWAVGSAGGSPLVEAVAGLDTWDSGVAPTSGGCRLPILEPGSAPASPAPVGTDRGGRTAGTLGTLRPGSSAGAGSILRLVLLRAPGPPLCSPPPSSSPGESGGGPGGPWSPSSSSTSSGPLAPSGGTALFWARRAALEKSASPGTELLPLLNPFKSR